MRATVAFDHRGFVKFFNADRAFGFIRLDSGQDVFFHQKAFSRNVEPRKDMRVRCDIEQAEKGPRATRVVQD